MSGAYIFLKKLSSEYHEITKFVIHLRNTLEMCQREFFLQHPHTYQILVGNIAGYTGVTN